MFENVLVGVDGRPNGRDAIALASRLTQPDGKLTLAHVHSGELRPTRAVTPGAVREEREASEKLLEGERAAAAVEAELVSVVDVTPGRGLHLQAETQGADLLVVGSCSRGAVGRVMLGDDTRAALNGAPCAVAVASRGLRRAPDPDRQGRRRIQRVGRERGRAGRCTRAGRADPGERSRDGSTAAQNLYLRRARAARYGREHRAHAGRGQRPPERAVRRRGPRGLRPHRRGARSIRR